MFCLTYGVGRCIVVLSNKERTAQAVRGNNMITRRELEGMGNVMTDEQWKEFNNDMAKVQDKIWDEEHPMDE